MNSATVLIRTVIFLMVMLFCNAYAFADRSVDCQQFKDEVDDAITSDQKRVDEINSSSNIAHTLVWENDSFALGGDYNYTNGMRLSWVHNPCRYKYESLKDGLKDSLRWLTGSDSFSVNSSGIFGMNMYTPNDLKESERIKTDRPYAGWTYGGVGLYASRLLPTDATFGESEIHQIELLIGLTGPISMQQEAQEYIHRNINSQMPQGWDHQIEQRFGFNALYLMRRESELSKYIRFVPHTGVSVGNLMQFVNAGAVVLLGKSNGEYPDLVLLPGVSPPKVPPEERKYSSYFAGWFSYVFVGIDGRYVFNSVFVEGFDENDNDIDLIHNVYDLMAGVAFGWGDFRLSYKMIWRSQEFTSPESRYEKGHRIGQFGITWLF